MGAENISTIWEGDSVGICQCKKNFRRYSHFWRKAHSDSVIPQHDNWCNTSPMYVPQTVCQQQECQPKEHYRRLVPCNHQPPDPDSWRGKFILPNWSCWNASLDRVPWGRRWGGRIMDLWWRRGRLFFKEAFICPLLPYNHEPLVKMEILPGDGLRRE